jgi:hypothetical protein
MTTRLWGITFDAADHLAQTRWWASALGWDIVFEGGDEGAILSPTQRGHSIVFVPVPEPKTTKNRIHFDLASDSEDQQAEIVERLVNAGAKRIDVVNPRTHRGSFWLIQRETNSA